MYGSCRGCGATLPPLKSPGRARIWCSQACRVSHHRANRGVFTVRQAAARFCASCGKGFAPSRPTARYCSPKCGWKHRAAGGASPQPVREWACPDCGVSVQTTGHTKRCAECRTKWNRAVNRRKANQRRGAWIGIVFTLDQIGDRDGWRCHICRRKVNRELPGTHNRGPTIDHLIPISDGGQDQPTNVALAHRACNVQRSNRGAAQLLLTG